MMRRSAGLGWDFLKAVEQTSQRIASSPEAGPVWQGHLRMRIVAGFPFTVLYAIEADQIFVVAVAHQSRRPGYWSKRVGG
jgi:plasmid stabilization system protein ParE